MGTAGQSVTLANSIIGVGILAMPYCFQQCGVLLASLILIVMGLVSRLCCYFLLKSALISKRRNFEFLAFHVFGSTGKMAVELGIIGFLMGTCIAYFVVVGDLGPQIISKIFNINQSDILRTSIMVIVSLVCVLPLGLLRNVDSLSNVSAATIAFYFCLVLKIIAEAASQLLTKDWYDRMELWKPSGLLQCVPIFSMALFCQTQLFEVFDSNPSLSLEKMNHVTKNAINICTSVYFTLGLFGYIAFCSHSISGNILMSLSPTWASDVIKLGFVMSLAFSFPLIIFPCRASLYSFLYKKVHAFQHDYIVNHSIPEGTFRCITVAIIGIALFISLLLPNIELVLGLLGSTIGVLICVVFPAACFVHVTSKNTNERILAKVVIILGLGIMILGTYANLQAAEMKRNVDRYDDKITQERIDKIVEDFFESKKLKKLDETNVKPVDNAKSLNVDSYKNDAPDRKDSEIQPPNPVPPDSVVEKERLQEHRNKDSAIAQSNEKLSNQIENKKTNDILIEEKFKEIESDEKLIDHPKNIMGALDEEKISNEIEVEKMSVIKTASDEQKLNKLKQELIETIKKHGKEQKELLKEQKEILDEIYKAKQEMQQNKRNDEELDSNEAKKIAVESIQKIANMAIQSLGGVSEKPVLPDVDSKKSEPLNKIANDALQDIAKKAVETIEALEKKDKEAVISEVKSSALNNEMINIETVSEDKIPIQKIPPIQANAQIPENVQSNMPNSNLQKFDNDNNKADNKIVRAENNQILANNNLKIKLPVDLLSHDTNQLHSLNQTNELNNTFGLETKVNGHVHSHSPDEPQSYQLGEDTQIRNSSGQNLNSFGNSVPIKISGPVDDKIISNVPIPLVMNNVQGNFQKIDVSKNIPNDHVVKSSKEVLQNKRSIDAANDHIEVLRRKREVIDCTLSESLSPENRIICINLNKNIPNEILKEVNLNDALIRMPVDPNAVHHLRSLKSYDDKKQKR